MDSESVLEELRDLRRTMRDLVVLSTLPAIWIGLGRTGIAESLADVLVKALRLELLYIRLREPGGDDAVEVVRSATRRDIAGEAARIGQLLAPLLDSEPGVVRSIQSPLGDGELRTSIVRFGHVGGYGVLIACSARATFPSEVDRVLLGIGANQTAIVIQRKKAEDLLRAEREWLRVTLESIGDGVIAADTSGRVTFLNRVAQALTGYTSDEAHGAPLESVFRIVHETTRAPVENPIRTVLRNGHIVGLANHTSLIAKDGTLRPIDDSAAPIRDEHGAIIGVILTFRDVGGQREKDHRIRESEERFRLMAETVPDIVFTASATGAVEYLNPRWYQYTGRSPDASVGWGWTDAIEPEDRDGVISSWTAAVRYGTPWRCHHRFRSRDGGHRWFATHARPVADQAGQIYRWFGTATDIDDLKRAEDELQQADRRKDEFLATLAHELRNPLAPILTGLHVIKLASGDVEKVERTRMTMLRQTQQMVRLVDDLLDVSRITRGRLDLRRERVELAAIFDSAIEATASLIQESSHELIVEPIEETIVLEADSTRLAQVLSNLLSNAAKYTRPKGRIWLRATRDGTDVIISVRDTGIGIPAAMFERVFEMFAQVEPAPDGGYRGLGIGLTLVKRLVQMHGGSVTVQSDGSGRGSEFAVRLPTVVEAADTPASPALSSDAARTPLRRRVLVVDDNSDAADMLSMMLEALGNEVRTAYDGLTALELGASFIPDVVLLDLGMPALDGYETARRAREQVWGKRAELVALTGWGQERDRQLTKAAGFDHHLVKPVESGALIKLLSGQGR